MKKFLLLALAALLPAFMKAQEDHFKVEDSQIIWQQVFSSDKSSEDVIGYLKSVVDIKDIRETPTGIMFQIATSAPIDVKKYGFKKGFVANYVVLNLLEAAGSVDFKDGRYRVTVRDIVLVANNASAERKGIETYALTRAGEIKSIFYSMNAAGPLEAYFTDIFTVKVKKDQEW